MQVSAVLEPLTPEERERVLAYVRIRFGDAGAEGSSATRPSAKADDGGSEPATEGSARTLGEVLGDCGAETEGDRVLVAAAYITDQAGAPDFQAADVTRALKQAGHPVSNITRALDVLIDQRPQPVVQHKKQGNTKQARKIYRVTEAGRKTVRGMQSRG